MDCPIVSRSNHDSLLRREKVAINGRMTITEVAKMVGVCSKTIVRWELTGKVSKAKRDWRGWRIYEKDAVKELIRFHESINDPVEKIRNSKSKTQHTSGR